jgi:hypothetical protein
VPRPLLHLKTLSALQLIPTYTVLVELVVLATAVSLCLFSRPSWTARFFKTHKHHVDPALSKFVLFISVQVFDCVQARFKTKIEELPEEIDTSSYMPTAGVSGGSEFMG